MSNEEIQKLIQLAVESGVAELEVQRGENRVRIRLAQFAHDVTMPATFPVQMNAPAAPALAPAHPAPPGPPSDAVLVKSPIVGTYYDAPSPGAPVFVKAGDMVEPGQVLCIIESMKLMNEIESEIAGTIVGKLMENGRPVEYGEALFAIRPRS